MTSVIEFDVRCAVCGALSRQVRPKELGAAGPPDLDLRPNGPARWGLPFTVQRCEACGYCARALGEAPPSAARTVASEVYRDVLESSRLPRLARAFFCAALVAEADGERERAGWHFAEAAWACDDSHAVEQARTCRARAAEMFRAALEWGEFDGPPEVCQTLVAEHLRRLGQFEVAAHWCDLAEQSIERSDDEHAEDTQRVSAFVRALAGEGDHRPHSLAEAFAED